MGGRGVALRRAAVVGSAPARERYRFHGKIRPAQGLQILDGQDVVGGGVELLEKAGVVTHLAFGSECGDLEALRRVEACHRSLPVQLPQHPPVPQMEGIIFADHAENGHEPHPFPENYK